MDFFFQFDAHAWLYSMAVYKMTATNLQNVLTRNMAIQFPLTKHRYSFRLRYEYYYFLIDSRKCAFIVSVWNECDVAIRARCGNS